MCLIIPRSHSYFPFESLVQSRIKVGSLAPGYRLFFSGKARKNAQNPENTPKVIFFEKFGKILQKYWQEEYEKFGEKKIY